MSEKSGSVIPAWLESSSRRKKSQEGKSGCAYKVGLRLEMKSKELLAVNPPVLFSPPHFHSNEKKSTINSPTLQGCGEGEGNLLLMPGKLIREPSCGCREQN